MGDHLIHFRTFGELTEFLALSTAKQLLRQMKAEGVSISRKGAKDQFRTKGNVIAHPKMMKRTVDPATGRTVWQSGKEGRLNTLLHEYGHARSVAGRAPAHMARQSKHYQDAKWWGRDADVSKMRVAAEKEANREARGWLNRHGKAGERQEYASAMTPAFKTYRDKGRQIAGSHRAPAPRPAQSPPQPAPQPAPQMPQGFPGGGLGTGLLVGGIGLGTAAGVIHARREYRKRQRVEY